MSTAVYTVLGAFASGISVIPGMTLFYTPAAFIYVATMWFGVWGLLGALFGSILQGPFYGYGYLIGMLFAGPDMLGALIAGIALRRKILNFDLTLKDKKSLGLWILFAAIIGPAAEAVTGTPFFVYPLGWYTPEFAATYGVVAWWVGDFTAVVIIGTILMRALSRYMVKTSLYHKGFVYRETSSSA